MDRKRPGMLLTVAIVALVLGSFGTCGGLIGIGSNLMQDQMQELSRDMATLSAHGNDEMARQQIAMQEQVEALTEAWRPALLSQQVLNLFASLALLVAGIFILRWKPAAIGLFTAAALANVVVDGAGGVIQVLFQLEMGEVMQTFMTSLTAADPNLAGAEGTMNAVATASTRVGMVFGVAWVLFKVAVYLGAVVYVRKPKVRALFTGA